MFSFIGGRASGGNSLIKDASPSRKTLDNSGRILDFIESQKLPPPRKAVSSSFGEVVVFWHDRIIDPSKRKPKEGYTEVSIGDDEFVLLHIDKTRWMSYSKGLSQDFLEILKFSLVLRHGN